MGSFCQMCKSLHEPTDNNSNTSNTTPTVSLPNNIPVCQNCDAYIFLLSEGISWCLVTRNFKTLRKCLRLNPIRRKQTLTTSLVY